MTSRQGQFSPGYPIVLEKIKLEIKKMDSVRSRSRCFSLHSIWKITGEPLTSEGLWNAKLMTKSALDTLVEEGTIVSYEIHSKFTGGPEWAFIVLPKRPRKKKTDQANVTA